MDVVSKLGVAAASLGLAMFAGYGLHALAEGAPTMAPLFYAGTLEADGKLAEGAYKIALTLVDSEMSEQAVCTSLSPNTQVTAGRFRVEVSQECVAQLRDKPDLWARIKFTNELTGATNELPKASKIGAVPYAMEAQRAVEARHALNADLAALATNAENSKETAHAKNADLATRATAADSATQATNCTNAEKSKSVEVHGHGAKLADSPGDNWYAACFRAAQSDMFACGLMANRWCGSHGYAGGWYVGESSDGTTRLVNCIK